MSDFRVDTISAANGTDPVTLTKQSAAKAYGKVDQTSSGHPEYSPSLNISSTSDDSTSQTTVSFTSNMSSAGYSISGGTDFAVQAYGQFQSGYAAAGSITIYNSPDYSLSLIDGRVSFSVNGDLA